MLLIPQLRADVVLDWNDLMIEAIRIDNSGPTISSRNLAILHASIYDAVNSVLRTHQPYRFQLETPADTSAEAAAVGAAYEVMSDLYQPLQATSQEAYENWLALAPRSAAVTNGLALGTRIARLLLEERAGDGSSTDFPYIPSDAPGQWRRTPPFFRPPFTPHWRYVTPFCIPDVEPFVPGPPPALDSPEYAEALQEVKSIGGSISSVRTPEQTQIAVFWSDFSYTSMPPGHWHLIAASLGQTLGTSLAETARLFALISLAQADAGIACWEAKFRYNLWRPVTAIQRADEDNNPWTVPDPGWNHLLAAPPFPAYTSGHSSFSKASAQVLTHFFGTDALTFDATSDSLPGVRRTFHSLAACADEVGMSRIYGGIHYSFDNIEGKRSGGAVGDYVSKNYLLPNAALPQASVEGFENTTPVLRVHGHIGRTCVLEASSKLGNWTPIGTNTAIIGGARLIDSSAPNATTRFYRVREE